MTTIIKRKLAKTGEREINPAATQERIEKLISYIELAQFEGDTLGVISPSYLMYLEQVLKHLRMRLVRGKFSK